jgi:chloramphenicol 3-O phosphotransferase
MGIDRFAYALPGRVQGQPTWPLLFRYVRRDERSPGPFTIETTPLGQRFVSGIHRTAASLAAVGLNVIVDHVLLEREWLEECRRLWSPYGVLFVGVRCPLAVIVERERDRTDRTLGQAEAQFAVIHRWGGYDVEVDTSEVRAEEAAARVAEVVERGLLRPPFPNLPSG